MTLVDLSDPNQEHIEPEAILRSLVTTKEAGVIIGKGGKNVADMRESTGVKAGVSKVVQGVHDRVLTISGTLVGVSAAYALIAKTLLDNPVTLPPPNTTTSTTTTTTTPSKEENNTCSIRLLISHNLMGTVIGRQGTKIKLIQDTCGVRMIASKTLLPQSTERVVEVKGTSESIHQAIIEICQCLLEDKDKSVGTILYNPTRASLIEPLTTLSSTSTLTTPLPPIISSASSPPSSRKRQQQHLRSGDNGNEPNTNTKTVAIPSDMIGCIIGKAGSKISEIRELSGSRISIAKIPHNESGDRMFTVQGTSKANECALYLLFSRMQTEKERRLRAATIASSVTIPTTTTVKNKV
ncbi:hypothetical protein BD770DRAFT_445562 [Pilaira anomala]|nr:hypothetical protein BD770DRAFT_445562 [Pilaira anomala]